MKKINYCGTIIIIGKPNVGKSTIINKLVKSKVSIVSKRPHTTQSNIIGIQNDEGIQAIYTDTPGISRKCTELINKKQHNCIKKLCNSSELILLVLNQTRWTLDDELVLQMIKNSITPTIAVINKNDKILQKISLLPYMEFLRKKYSFQEIIPISGKTGDNIDLLSNIVQKTLPISEPQFSSNQVTNNSLHFQISEIIREKFIFYLGNELSHSIKIIIESINLKKRVYIIKGIIIVTNNSHKKIIIGYQGKKIKLCGTIARKELEKYLKSSVYLSLFVKNKKIHYANLYT
ncbi:MAG: GTPase Era [Buchnera aphidicola (Kaburagia rhusicola ensigallis)]